MKNQIHVIDINVSIYIARLQFSVVLFLLFFISYPQVFTYFCYLSQTKTLMVWTDHKIILWHANATDQLKHLYQNCTNFWLVCRSKNLELSMEGVPQTSKRDTFFFSLQFSLILWQCPSAKSKIPLMVSKKNTETSF